MKKPPIYLQVLHDESDPVGSLGRGTHYSVYRVVVSHDASGKFLTEAQHHDFAVIWDEDHNTKIFEVIDHLYRNGELSAFTIVGERKGTLTAILSPDLDSKNRASSLATKLRSICDGLEVDSWSSCVVSTNDPHNGIINDADVKVKPYLENIQNRWQLGLKKMEPH